VAGIAIDVGQVIGPGIPAVTYGDLRQWQVETTDLAETDITRVAVDQQVTITADALPDQVLKGRVVRIARMANDHSGDRVFRVTVALLGNSDLRWGMTTNVEFDTGQ
jgi:multidrug resistance efflux pump